MRKAELGQALKKKQEEIDKTVMVPMLLVLGGWDASCSKLESRYAGRHSSTESMHARLHQNFTVIIFIPHILLLWTRKGRTDLTMPHATLPSPGFQALILCGPGASLDTFTSNPSDFPKALVPVANRPMMWYPLDWCYRMGVSSTYVYELPQYRRF